MRKRAASLRKPKPSAFRRRSSKTCAAFASSLQTAKRRGVSLELSSGPDSNINRSTSSQYVDTIIAPFELDPDARRQSGIGFALGGQAFTRNRIGGLDLLSRAGAHADLFTKPPVQRCPGHARQRPAVDRAVGPVAPGSCSTSGGGTAGNLYSTGFGASLDWLKQLGPRTQLELTGSRVRQNIEPNPGQDAWRTSVGADCRAAAGGRLHRAHIAALCGARRHAFVRKACVSSARSCCLRKGLRLVTAYCRFRLHPDARARAAVPVRQDAARLADRPHRRDHPRQGSARRLLTVGPRDPKRQPGEHRAVRLPPHAPRPGGQPQLLGGFELFLGHHRARNPGPWRKRRGRRIR